MTRYAILIAGQSNASGLNKGPIMDGLGEPEEQLDTGIRQIYTGQPADDLRYAPFSPPFVQKPYLDAQFELKAVCPTQSLGPDGSPESVSFWFHFVKQLKTLMMPGDELWCISAAQPGTALLLTKTCIGRSSWHPDRQMVQSPVSPFDLEAIEVPAYAQAVALFNNAIALHNLTPAAIIWHQGESDVIPPPGVSPNPDYVTDLNEMFAAFRTDITGATATLPIVTGLFSQYHRDVNAVGAAVFSHYSGLIDTPVDNVACAEMRDLVEVETNFQEVVNGEGYGVHFTAGAMRIIGGRYLDAFLPLNTIIPVTSVPTPIPTPLPVVPAAAEAIQYQSLILVQDRSNDLVLGINTNYTPARVGWVAPDEPHIVLWQILNHQLPNLTGDIGQSDEINLVSRANNGSIPTDTYLQVTLDNELLLVLEYEVRAAFSFSGTNTNSVVEDSDFLQLKSGGVNSLANDGLGAAIMRSVAPSSLKLEMVLPDGILPPLTPLPPTMSNDPIQFCDTVYLQSGLKRFALNYEITPAAVGWVLLPDTDDLELQICPPYNNPSRSGSLLVGDYIQLRYVQNSSRVVGFSAGGQTELRFSEATDWLVVSPTSPDGTEVRPSINIGLEYVGKRLSNDGANRAPTTANSLQHVVNIHTILFELGTSETICPDPLPPPAGEPTPPATGPAPVPTPVQGDICFGDNLHVRDLNTLLFLGYRIHQGNWSLGWVPAGDPFILTVTLEQPVAGANGRMSRAIQVIQGERVRIQYADCSTQLWSNFLGSPSGGSSSRFDTELKQNVRLDGNTNGLPLTYSSTVCIEAPNPIDSADYAGLGNVLGDAFMLNMGNPNFETRKSRVRFEPAPAPAIFTPLNPTPADFHYGNEVKLFDVFRYKYLAEQGVDARWDLDQSDAITLLILPEESDPNPGRTDAVLMGNVIRLFNPLTGQYLKGVEAGGNMIFDSSSQDINLGGTLGVPLSSMFFVTLDINGHPFNTGLDCNALTKSTSTDYSYIQFQPGSGFFGGSPGLSPGAPRNVVAVVQGADVLVTFDPPLSVGGGPITGYKVTSDPDMVMATGVTTSIIVPGLTPGTSYTFTVQAENIYGLGSPGGSPGGPSNEVTIPIAPTPPPTPDDGVAAGHFLCIRSIVNDGYVQLDAQQRLSVGTTASSALVFQVTEITNPGPNATVRLLEVNDRHVLFGTSSLTLVNAIGQPPTFNLWPFSTTIPIGYGVGQGFSLEFNEKAWKHGTPVSLGTFASPTFDSTIFYFERKLGGSPTPTPPPPTPNPIQYCDYVWVEDIFRAFDRLGLNNGDVEWVSNGNILDMELKIIGPTSDPTRVGDVKFGDEIRLYFSPTDSYVWFPSPVCGPVELRQGQWSDILIGVSSPLGTPVTVQSVLQLEIGDCKLGTNNLGGAITTDDPDEISTLQLVPSPPPPTPAPTPAPTPVITGSTVTAGDYVCIRSLIGNGYIKNNLTNQLIVGDGNNSDALTFFVQEITYPGVNGSVRLIEVNSNYIEFNATDSTLEPLLGGLAPAINLWPFIVSAPLGYGPDQGFGFEKNSTAWKHGNPITLGQFSSPTFDFTVFYFEQCDEPAPTPIPTPVPTPAATDAPTPAIIGSPIFYGSIVCVRDFIRALHLGANGTNGMWVPSEFGFIVEGDGKLPGQEVLVGDVIRLYNPPGDYRFWSPSGGGIIKYRTSTSSPILVEGPIIGQVLTTETIVKLSVDGLALGNNEIDAGALTTSNATLHSMIQFCNTTLPPTPPADEPTPDCPPVVGAPVIVLRDRLGAMIACRTNRTVLMVVSVVAVIVLILLLCLLYVF